MDAYLHFIPAACIVFAIVMVVWTLVTVYNMMTAEETLIKVLNNDPSTERVRDLVENATGAVYVLIEKHILDLPYKRQEHIRRIVESGHYEKLVSFIEKAAKKRESNTDTKEWGGV